MRGWAICRRFFSIAILGLLLFTVSASGGRQGWRLQTSYDAARHWVWRSEWTIPFSPYQADMMQQIIEDATANLPSGHYTHDMSKWPPVIDDLITRDDLGPRQVLSYIWWHDWAVMPYSDALPKELHATALKLRYDSLSPEWAVVAGMACMKHWQSDGRLQPSFPYLTGEFFRKAQAKDPQWDLPYYCLLATYQRFVMDQIPQDLRYNHPFAKMKPYLRPSPEKVKETTQELMRGYIAATDYSHMLTPPWTNKVAFNFTIPYPKSLEGPPYIVSADAIGEVDWLARQVLEISIDEKNAEDAALVIDFCTAAITHEAGLYSHRLDYLLGMLTSTMYLRCADVEIAEELKKAAACYSKLYEVNVPTIEYERTYPHREVSYEEANRQLRSKTEESGVIEPLQRSSARLRELGPDALAPEGLREGYYALRSDAATINRAAWPLSQEADRCWSLIPIQAQLTDKGRVAISYLVGAMLSTDRSSGECMSGWYERCPGAFDEPGASFSQRATAAYWQFPYNDYSLPRELMVIIRDNKSLADELSPEWLYALSRLARTAAQRRGQDTKKDSAELQHFGDLADDYIMLAADKAPEWAQVQEDKLDIVLDKALRNASGKGSADLTLPQSLWLSNHMRYVSDEDLEASYQAIVGFINADDDRIWLPPPWACRIDRSRLTEIAPGSKIIGYALERPQMGEYYALFGWDLRPARFLAKLGYRKKSPAIMAAAFTYQERLLTLRADEFSSAYIRARILQETCDAITSYLVDTPARAELRELAETVNKHCSEAHFQYMMKTQDYRLSPEEQAAVKAAYKLEQDELMKEVIAATQRAKEIVNGLNESDFADLDHGGKRGS